MATSEIYETAFDEDVQNDTTNQCPECDGRVATNVAETVCEKCGLVLEDERIDHGPEWRSFSDDEQNRERTGAPLTATRHDRGLSTEIGRGTDANGNQLSGRKRRQLGRLRREQSRGRFQSKAERNLAHGLGEVRRISSGLDLTETIRDQACQLFRSAQNEDLLRGHSIEAMAAASVHGACRCNGLSRTLEEITEPARVEQARVRTAYQTLNTELGLPAQPVRPSGFIPQLASELDIPEQIRHRARQLADQAESAGAVSGVDPTGFAAACIYKAGCDAGRLMVQSEVAWAANVSTVTIRTHRDTLDELAV
ncbi:transcription initiation factor IIB family protein (plasmid) [Halorussus limi]|uniref:Transcription initiation factor IIB n=1 Tax=Halorussus limi TaxID=2938695 RepID=A0A8U0I1J0_9EURY|nr:transcription initiation factor IIB family protein [Halorussus limi]UPV77120.1 transcription initiation factor IIB family protein [Halorussus limi]